MGKKLRSITQRTQTGENVNENEHLTKPRTWAGLVFVCAGRSTVCCSNWLRTGKSSWFCALLGKNVWNDGDFSVALPIYVAFLLFGDKPRPFEQDYPYSIFLYLLIASLVVGNPEISSFLV